MPETTQLRREAYVCADREKRDPGNQLRIPELKEFPFRCQI